MARRRTKGAAVPAKPTGASRRAPKGEGRRTAAANKRIHEIVERYVGSLVEAVREEVRRSVVENVRGLLGGRDGATRGRRAGGKRRVLTCIAPGCTNPSKGPRFHYLCEKHKDAKKADYEGWRKLRREKDAAAAAS